MQSQLSLSNRKKKEFCGSSDQYKGHALISGSSRTVCKSHEIICKVSIIKLGPTSVRT